MKYGRIMQVLDGCSPHNAAVTMHVTMLGANCISFTVDLVLRGAVRMYVHTYSHRHRKINMTS